jgi:hypothetical protein
MSLSKERALHQFWSGFGLKAYDEMTVPTGDDAPALPYITYEVITDNIGHPVTCTASIWYRSSTWTEITQIKDQIAETIGYGHKMIKIDGGYMYLTRGTPFAQRMADDSDDMIRRIYVQLDCEYLTAQ